MKAALIILMSAVVVFHLAVGCCASISHASAHREAGHAHCHGDSDAAHHHHDAGDEESAPEAPQESPCSALGCAAVLTGKLAAPTHDGLATPAMLSSPPVTLTLQSPVGSAPPSWPDGLRTPLPLFLRCQRLLL